MGKVRNRKPVYEQDKLISIHKRNAIDELVLQMLIDMMAEQTDELATQATENCGYEVTEEEVGERLAEIHRLIENPPFVPTSQYPS
jgi:hypothetical protein